MRRNIFCFNWLTVFLLSIFLLTSCNANPKVIETNLSEGKGESVEKNRITTTESEYKSSKANGTYLPDFRMAARKSVDAVVHVKSLVDGKPMTYDDVIMEFGQQVRTHQIIGLSNIAQPGQTPSIRRWPHFNVFDPTTLC